MSHCSDRLSVDECFHHKWLSDNENINLQITPKFRDEVDADENTAEDVTEDDSEEENTEEENKENSDIFANQPTLPALNVAKVQLEKSLSMSIFPECAPTSPKVSRKALDDDEDDINTQVKEIVKKYQVSEGQPKLSTPSVKCCENTSECIICCRHQESDTTSLVDIKSSTSSAIELNKEIACWDYPTKKKFINTKET